MYVVLEVPVWHSRLRIQCCCSCGTGCNCGMGSVPGLGIPHATDAGEKKSLQWKRRGFCERNLYLLSWTHVLDISKSYSPNKSRLKRPYRKKGKMVEDKGDTLALSHKHTH